MSDYYSKTAAPTTGSSLSSSVIRAEFALIEAGFDKFPALSGNGSKFLRINSGATAVEALSSAISANLSALGGLTSAADKAPYFTGSGAAAVMDFTAGGRALVNSAGTADTFPYFSASNTVTLGSVTAAGRALLDDANATAQLVTLGLTASAAEINAAAVGSVASVTVELGGGFTAGESVKCSRIGNVVTITGTTGSIAHPSNNSPDSAAEIIPASFRPASTISNVFWHTTAHIALVSITSAGLFRIEYRDWTGTLSAQSQTGVAPTISYAV